MPAKRSAAQRPARPDVVWQQSKTLSDWWAKTVFDSDPAQPATSHPHPDERSAES